MAGLEPIGFVEDGPSARHTGACETGADARPPQLG
jgi:hypothetical protein